jgi:hypothetical protein
MKKRWTKRDRGTLRDQIEHFVTFNVLYRGPDALVVPD